MFDLVPRSEGSPDGYPNGWPPSVWVAGGPGVVAIGSYCDADTREGPGETLAEMTEEGEIIYHSDSECRLALWTSPDGVTWSLDREALSTPPDCVGVPCELVIFDVVSARFGLVALGYAWSDNLLYFSPDGLDWEIALRAPPEDELIRLVALEDSVLVIGVDALWSTTDGRTWTRTADSHAPTFFQDVIPFGRGIVAVGETADDERRPAAWYSDDGLTWREATMIGSESSQGSFLYAVATVDGSLVALSKNVNSDGVTVWTSPDGSTWTEGTGPALQDGVFGSGLFTTRLGVIADGHEDSNTPLWIWRPPDG